MGLPRSHERLRRLVPSLLGLCLAGCSSSGSSLIPPGTRVLPSNVVRQGQASITLTHTPEGGGLGTPIHVDLEDLAIAIDPGSTGDTLVIDVAVPHGAKEGPRTLTIETANQTTTLVDVVDVSAIAASPRGLDSNLGTTSSPFRSLKQAVLVSGAGDTIRLAPGSYDRENGETWGYDLPERLTIAGDGAKRPELKNVNGGVRPGNASAVVVSGDLVLRGVALADFDVGARLTRPARLTIDDVIIRSSRDAAVRVDESAPGSTIMTTGAMTAFQSAVGSAIVVEGPESSVMLREGSVEAGVDAVVLRRCNDCKLDASGTVFTISGTDAVAVLADETSQRTQISMKGAHLYGGVFVADAEATVSIDATTIDESAGHAGINFAGSKLTVTDSLVRAPSSPYGISLRAGEMSLSGVTLEKGNYCVYQIAGRSKLRKTTITGYGAVGYYLADGDLDLGTADEAGDNVFGGPTESTALFGIYHDSGSPSVTCSNTSFDGVVPPAGTLQAGTEPIVEPGKYLVNIGRTMTFFRATEQP